MSPDRVKLTVAPRSVRVSEGSSLAALLALTERDASAALERARSEAAAAARAEMADEVAHIVEGCRREVLALRESMLDTAVEIATVLAESVVRHELSSDIDLAGVVRLCLASTSAEPSTCTLRVHPDAIASLESSGAAARVKLVPDADLAPGEVRLDTPVGMLVHDPMSALAQARDALLAELEADA